MRTAIRRLLKLLSFRIFFLLDRIGIHLLPKHYYSPVPDFRWLRENRELWTGRSALVGIEWDVDAQMKWLREACEPYYAEVAGLSVYRDIIESRFGPGYGPIESQVLHCVVRKHAPKRIVEIGSGASTACMVHAIERNVADGRNDTEITCVEPYPRDAFRRMPRIKHIEKMCQAVPPLVFECLEAGDLLFVDSTHSLRVGSDVVRIYLDILPRLPAGVLIHVHDIYLPYMYSRHVLETYFGWQETVLLTALLVNNPRLRILASESGLHYDKRREMVELLSDYRPEPDVDGLPAVEGTVRRRGLVTPPADAEHYPSSTWLVTQ